MGMSIIENVRSWNEMTIPFHSFGDNTRMTKFPNWNGIKFNQISKIPLLINIPKKKTICIHCLPHGSSATPHGLVVVAATPMARGWCNHP
jgi:hypothetical protein